MPNVTKMLYKEATDSCSAQDYLWGTSMMRFSQSLCKYKDPQRYNNNKNNCDKNNNSDKRERFGRNFDF